MTLKIQMISLLVSFIYGFLFYLVFIKIHSYLITKKKKIIYNLSFATVISLGYFLIMYLFNSGYLHLYYLLSIALGILIAYKMTK